MPPTNAVHSAAQHGPLIRADWWRALQTGLEGGCVRRAGLSSDGPTMSWVLHTCTTSAELPHKTPPGVDGAFRAQQIQTPVHRRTQQYLWLHLECRVNPLPTDRLQPSHTARYSLPLPFIAHDPLLWEIPEEKLSPPQVSATRPLPLGCSSASVTRSRILTRAGAVPSTPHPPLEAAWPLLCSPAECQYRCGLDSNCCMQQPYDTGVSRICNSPPGEQTRCRTSITPCDPSCLC